MENNTTFETGATSAAVNELILYTDNTKELANSRDIIYADLFKNKMDAAPFFFRKLLTLATNAFIHEFPGTHWQTSVMNERQKKEYCQIYANRFSDWKREKELQAKQK